MKFVHTDSPYFEFRDKKIPFGNAHTKMAKFWTFMHRKLKGPNVWNFTHTKKVHIF